MTKRFAALTGTLLALATFIIFIRYTEFGAGMIAAISRNGQWLLPMIITSALIDSINPCAFSILLLTIAFLFNLGKMRTDILKIGLAYIFGIFLIYFLIGLGIIQALHLFNTPHFMAKVGSFVLILMGLIGLIDEFFPSFPIKLQIPKGTHRQIAILMEKASFPAAFILGVLVGIFEFPCTGGPYLMALGLLHDQATYLSGVLYLFLYNLVFVSPLLLILATTSDKVLLDKVKEWKKTNTGSMRLYGALGMILLGILILTL